MPAKSSLRRFLLPLLAVALIPLTLLGANTAQTMFVGFQKGAYYIGLKPIDRLSFFGAPPVGQAAKTLTSRAALEKYGLVGTGGTGGAATANISGVAVLNNYLSGTLTSGALTTAAGGSYTLALTDNAITANSIVEAFVDNGTNTTAGLALSTVTPAAGGATIVVFNRHASAALDGTIKVRFVVAQ